MPRKFISMFTRPGLSILLSAFFFACCGCSTIPLSKSAPVGDSSPLENVIRFYQGPLDHLSAVKIGECPMEPSCSQYAVQAMRKHGMLLGWFMTCDRLMRCGRDELDLSPKILAYGKWKCFDPLDQNDDWRENY